MHISALHKHPGSSLGQQLVLFQYSLAPAGQNLKLCHKVIFCILNKTAGNLFARKTEQSAEETSFKGEFGSQEGGKKKSGSLSILAPVCYSVCY